MLAQPRHVGEQPLVGGLAQREVEQHVVGGRRRGPRRTPRRCAAPAPPCPAGPSGSPMSLAVSTSPASPPSAGPTWLPNIAPPALPSIPISGPAIAWASSGIALPIAPTTCSATGSTSTRHTSVVCSIHSARLQAAVVLTPEGSTVASSSQWSASRMASATRVWSLRSGLGSGSWADGTTGDVGGEGPVHRPVVRRHHRLHLAHQRRRGRACRRPRAAARTAAPERVEDLLEGRALEGVVVRSVVVHAHRNYRSRPMRPDRVLSWMRPLALSPRCVRRCPGPSAAGRS